MSKQPPTCEWCNVPLANLKAEKDYETNLLIQPPHAQTPYRPCPRTYHLTHTGKFPECKKIKDAWMEKHRDKMEAAGYGRGADAP